MVQKPNMKSKSKTQQAGGGTQTAEKSTKKKFKRVSEYGRQLEEKQNVKRAYGVREKQFRRFFKKATCMQGAPGENLLSLLERRLDNAVFRLKMAITCAQARQMVVHGHIIVNGKKVTRPAYQVVPGDVICLKEGSLKKDKFMEVVVNKRMNVAIKVPEWLELVKKDTSGKVLRDPVRSDVQFPVEEHLIVELYSK